MMIRPQSFPIVSDKKSSFLFQEGGRSCQKAVHSNLPVNIPIDTTR